jgi:hypothetical protein
VPFTRRKERFSLASNSSNDSATSPRRRQKPVAEYSYTNAQGEVAETYEYEARGSDVLLRKVKLRFPDGRTDKRWDHFDDKSGDWKPGYTHLKPKVEPAFYRGRELRERLDNPGDGFFEPDGREVVVVDGEKDVNTSWEHSRPAVCSPHNMGVWKRAELERFLPYRERITFVVVPDQDGGKGEEQASKFTYLATSMGFSVRVHRPRAGKDLTDHFAAGLGWDDLSTEAPGTRSKANGWLARAVKKVEDGGYRNDTGLWLAGQLWDSARLARADLEAVMREYQERVEAREEPYYTWSEALATINQVCNRERRAPAGRAEWNGDGGADLSFDDLVELKLNNLREAELDRRAYEAAQKLFAAEQLSVSGRSRILSWKQIKEVQPPDFLVNGWVPVASFGVVYGKPGEFKTFVTSDLAGAVATGRPWLGNPVTRAGPVVYVAAEGSSGVSVRLLGWAKQRGTEPTEFRMLPEVVNLLDPGAVATLLAELAEVEPAPVLVVFDTMARSMVGGDENSARDVGRVIDAGARVIAELGAAVAYVHHQGLDGERGRGSTALRGAADWMAQVKKTSDREGEVKNTKQKDAPEAPTLRFAVKEVEGIETVAGPRTTLVPELMGIVAPPPPVDPNQREAEAQAVARALKKAGRPMSVRQLKHPGVVDSECRKDRIEKALEYLITDMGAPVELGTTANKQGTTYLWKGR